MPNLPTDSLYKFMAIAGLVFIVSGIYFGLNKSHEFEIKMADVSKDSQIINVKVTNLLEQTEELKEKVVEWEKNRNEKLRETYITEVKQIRQNRDQLEILRIELNQKLDLVKVTGFELKLARIYMYFGLFIGCLFVILGFTFWYLKVQFYLDKIIKKKAGY